ncbi:MULTISPECIES: M16 family metallopeptidase [Mesonia]|uniref:M16 family metallopeptidase n=1 Tax=Mesonia TaxID=232115 RepID=UPI00176E38C4|nr:MULTISPECIES: pitrilysin family protein [Mesonia]HIB36645.1 insulinase family protein [Mesonia sp.]HIO27404.1 insulinase family protein [Flavobacteriaceae bacterium]|tara:strand:+ start:191 stop:1516 length:1326 start_codon:yes stop_codon:yes gene_type:complete
MIKRISLAAFTLLATYAGFAQQVEFTEYELDNGLDVILHQDNTAPVVTVGVMYHVGAKDEEEGRTGFAHFFEHLLFEGTENIDRGEWFNIVAANGGSNNANTTQDRTYYYETFPSNNLKLGLWMESERMLHPVINQIGVDTQNEVVKEEKRTRIDNAPYGKIIYSTGISPYMFEKHPYKNSVIGTMEDLDAAQLDEFKAFFDKYYGPNNATLVIAGDFEEEETKKWIKSYFASIPKGPEVERVDIKEEPITEEIVATEYDDNIQIPVKAYVYRTPSMKDRDAYVLDMISSILTDGKSSRMYKKMVDEDKEALQVLAFPRSQEDYGMYVMGALAMGDTPLEQLGESMDEEIKKLQTELISEKEYQKLQNKFENRFVSSNSSVQGIAASLATYHMLYGDVDLINDEIKIYRSITREDIKEVANKYLKKNQRLNLDYLPTPESK